MKKIALIGLFFGSFAMAQNSYYASLPYFSYLDYNGKTKKKDAFVKGVYFSIFKSPWKAEFDVEGTDIRYKYHTSDLSQGDFSFFLSYYQGYDLAYKIGIHYINSTNKLTDGGAIYKLGFLKYKSFVYNSGIDFYYSNYSNLSISPKLIQISPKIGFNFAEYQSAIGSFYIETKVDYIRILKNKIANDLDNYYRSLEINLKNYNGNFTTSLSGWFGKRAYAVENDGFIVNNIDDEQTGGFKVGEEYKINKVQSLKFEYTYTKFKENGNSDSKTYLFSFNYSF